MAGLLLGGVLILIALILGGIQLLHLFSGAIYGSSSNKWYFYGSVGAIGLVGIILAAWSLMKKGTPPKATQ